jgi:ABC-type multidrug transport system ATPase subunit
MQTFECQKIALRLGDNTIFNDFNFSFNGPGLVLFEGENGTGKSSALKMLAGFLTPSDGIILFYGKTVDKIGAKDFSFLTTTSLGLINELTGIEHIRIIAESLGIPIEMVQLKILEFSKIEIFNEILLKKVVDFSQGMRQFLRLFLHLFFEPKILFLDEPFLYLSPALKDFIQGQVEKIASHSLVFITDQQFTWNPSGKSIKIILGGK